jgi:hypothetical protein
MTKRSDDHSQDNNPLTARNVVPSPEECRSEMKQYKGEESIYKWPVVPRSCFENKNIPDYLRNPHKWIKCSLEDVSEEDMSDEASMLSAWCLAYSSYLIKILILQLNLHEQNDISFSDQ